MLNHELAKLLPIGVLLDVRGNIFKTLHKEALPFLEVLEVEMRFEKVDQCGRSFLRSVGEEWEDSHHRLGSLLVLWLLVNGIAEFLQDH